MILIALDVQRVSHLIQQQFIEQQKREKIKNKKQRIQIFSI